PLFEINPDFIPDPVDYDAAQTAIVTVTGEPGPLPEGMRLRPMSREAVKQLEATVIHILGDHLT
ncbi:MAG: hypothetical protein ACE5DX_05230, partial [Candidatus Dojkabacteria bacterium]